jgi:hypothetical protein
MEQVESVEYFHIGLAGHEVIFAENCPAESYLDNGAQLQLANIDAHFVAAGEDSLPVSCLQLLEHGFILDAIHRRLSVRAGIVRPEARGAMRGYVDIAGPLVCAGWAQYEDQPEVPVCLDILPDGQRVARVLANHHRADLRAAGYGSGNHGFVANLPLGLTGKIEVRRTSDQAVLALMGDAQSRIAWTSLCPA